MCRGGRPAPGSAPIREASPLHPPPPAAPSPIDQPPQLQAPAAARSAGRPRPRSRRPRTSRQTRGSSTSPPACRSFFPGFADLQARHGVRRRIESGRAAAIPAEICSRPPSSSTARPRTPRRRRSPTSSRPSRRGAGQGAGRFREREDPIPGHAGCAWTWDRPEHGQAVPVSNDAAASPTRTCLGRDGHGCVRLADSHGAAQWRSAGRSDIRPADERLQRSSGKAGRRRLFTRPNSGTDYGREQPSSTNQINAENWRSQQTINAENRRSEIAQDHEDWRAQQGDVIRMQTVREEAVRNGQAFSQESVPADESRFKRGTSPSPALSSNH